MELDRVGIRGLAYLLENTKTRSAKPNLVYDRVLETLSEFLGVTKYELLKAVEDAKTELFMRGSPASTPSLAIREDIKELGPMGKRIYPAIAAAAFLGSFSTGLHGVPIKLFEDLGVDEPRFIVALSLLLERVLAFLGRDEAYRVRLDRNDGLAVAAESEVVAGKNGLIMQALIGERGEYSDRLVAETLYINRIASTPSDTFLHAVLGLISFSSSFDEAAELANRLRGLKPRDVLSFFSLVGFYIGVPGLRKKIRKIQRASRTYRSVPITHDVLMNALSRYKSNEYFGPGAVSPASVISRLLKRSLASSEAEALAAAMTIDLRRDTLARVAEEDDVRLLVSDALSALFKSLSFIYTSEQAHNIPVGIVVSDGIRRVPAGEETPLYEFLRREFESFDVKYMDDVIFELPFRLRLIKKTFAEGVSAKIEVPKALAFIFSLGAPMRKRTAQKLLAFVADALQTGRLSSAEIYYEDGKTRLKYSRSTRISSTRRILETNFPLLPEIFAFSRIVRGILDRNSPGTRVRPAGVAERFSSRFTREFLRLRKKHIGRQKRFLYLERLHPIVLISLPLALVTSYQGESLMELLEYIDFSGDHPSKATLRISRGDAEGIFRKLREVLSLDPVSIDVDHVHLFKILASNGFTLSFRDEVREKNLRPLTLRDVIELSMLVRRTITPEEAIYTLFRLASNFGYASLYGEAETVVTLAYSRGAVGLVNTSALGDVAAKAAIRDVVPFDSSFLSEASKRRLAVRDERRLQEYFGSFFRNVSEGYAPMIARGGNKRYVRLIEI